MSVRVFVANDHEILRGALRAVINMQSDMDVVGEAATGLDAELGIKETNPDVVLMDISVVKRALSTELLTAIRAVAQGRTLVDASVGLESAQPSTWSSATGTARLTVREPQLRRSCARRSRPLRALIDPS